VVDHHEAGEELALVADVTASEMKGENLSWFSISEA